MSGGRIVTADFETTTDLDDCRVWAWAVCDVYNIENIEYGNSINSFFKYIYNSDIKDIWFHNLAFDGKFIIDFLLKNGYEFSDDRYISPKQFSTIISNKGKWYQIKIKFNRNRAVTIKDSLKIYPMSIKAIGRTFKFEEQKGELDYRAYRQIGHELTDEEKYYISHDVIIAARALKINFDSGASKLTIGSNAFAFYKKQVGNLFSKNFPVLSEEIDAFARRAYRGGYTYCNPKYAGKDIYGGISVDYNSMYPSQMISKPLPYGIPEMFDGEYQQDDLMPLYIQQFTCMFNVKPNHVPTLQLRNYGYGQHDYVSNTHEPVTLTLSNVDIDLMFRNYDVDILSWDGGLKFKASKNLFVDYVKYWGDKKKNDKDGARQLDKLYLNNLYGKFATSTDVTPKYPVLIDDVVKYVMGDDDTREPIYCPVAVFITAYARDELVTAILDNYDRFIYCDTDSMHLIGSETPKNIRLHDTEFCAWKVEGSFTRARHLRAKTYIWDLPTDSEGRHIVEVKCAGMPDNIKEHCSFDNFYIGFSNFEKDGNGKIVLDSYGQPIIKPGWGKLMPKEVPGGVVFVDGKFEIK